MYIRIKKFNSQIKEEFDSLKESMVLKGSDKEVYITQCPSYWHKLIFIETATFELSDFLKMRDAEYWEGRDKRVNIEQSRFILNRVRKYKNNKHT
jgi:hypothetical protein